MLLPVTHILPLALIRRKRTLPVPGEVFVRSGQSVGANDVIAQADLHAEHIVLDIARGLGVPRAKSGAYLQREIGDEIPQDGVIASRGGLTSRVVRAPSPGILVAVSGGLAVLQVKNDPFELLAGVPGTIIKIEADFGAIIESSGAWIQGVWGNDKTNAGVMEIATPEPDGTIQAKQIDPSQRGMILLAGNCRDRKVLITLKEMKLRGLILGSMAAKLTPLASKMPYPIIVIDGFGNIPMNSTAFKLLASNAKREVTINAKTLNRFTGDRPEIIIPLEGAGSPPIPIDLDQVRIGHQVRVINSPHFGQVGTISNLISSKVRFPSGLRLDAVHIDFENGETGVIPVANIEVLG